MSEQADVRIRERIGSRAGMAGIRAAMYGEMAASASRERPWRERERDWDAALEGAIRFIEAAGLDERTSRHLLDEAATTRNAGVVYGWETPVAHLCDRLATEFRVRVREG